MTWAVEFEEAYDAWDETTDIEDDVEIRLAVLEYMGSWRAAGAPDDADFDRIRLTYSCPVPGTPVFVEFVSVPTADPPAIIVRRFA